jgi:hypothetical protein
MRTFLIAVAAVLVAAPAAFADTAVEELALARDGCTSSDPPPNFRLDWSPGSSTTGCGNLAAGLNNAPIFPATPDIYPSSKAVGAITLDPSRPIVVRVSISSYTGTKGGVGPETIDISLTGKNPQNKTVNLGSASQTKAAQDELQNGNYIAELSVPLTAALGGKYKSVSLSLSVGGAQFGGFVKDDGNSVVRLPIPGDVDATPPDAG